MFLSSEHVAVYVFHEGAGKRIHAQRHTRGKHQTADNPVMQTKSRNNQKKLSLKKKLLPISLLLKAQLTETIHHKIGLNKKNRARQISGSVKYFWDRAILIHNLSKITCFSSRSGKLQWL